jgi:hypothetical protein
LEEETLIPNQRNPRGEKKRRETLDWGLGGGGGGGEKREKRKEKTEKVCKTGIKKYEIFFCKEKKRSIC